MGGTKGAYSCNKEGVRDGLCLLILQTVCSMMYLENASVMTMICLNGPSLANGPNRSMCMRSLGFDAGSSACSGALGL